MCFRKFLLFIFIGLVPMLQADDDIIFVLGSGGTKGLAHVGAIEELEALKLEPSCIVGCSAGAIVGALYAQDKDIRSVYEALIDKTTDDFLDLSFFNAGSFSSRSKMEAFLDEYLTAKDFADLKIKLVIVATDFDTGKCTYFTEGSLRDAILASSCLPAVFEPYPIDGNHYIDGGLSAPLPLEYARKMDQVKVLGIDISPSLDSFESSGTLSVLRKSFEIIYQNLGEAAYDHADLVLKMDFSNIQSPLDDSQNEEIYKRGREVVIEKQNEIQNLFL